MTSLRVLARPVLLMFLLSGCVPALYSTPDSQDKHHAQIEKSTQAPITIESSPKVEPTKERPLKSDSAQAANTIDGAARNRPKTFATNPKDSSGQVKKIQPVKENSGQVKKIQPIKENSDQVKKHQPILDEALDFCGVSQDFWQKGELENALEALDQAYSLILKIDTLDDPETHPAKRRFAFPDLKTHPRNLRLPQYCCQRES